MKNYENLFDVLSDFYIFHDCYFTLSIVDEKTLYVNADNGKKIKLTLNRKVREVTSIELYKFHGKGKIKGFLLDDNEFDEFIKRTYELIYVYMSNVSSLIIECELPREDKKYPYWSVLIDINEIETVEII